MFIQGVTEGAVRAEGVWGCGTRRSGRASRRLASYRVRLSRHLPQAPESGELGRCSRGPALQGGCVVQGRPLRCRAVAQPVAGGLCSSSWRCDVDMTDTEGRWWWCWGWWGGALVRGHRGGVVFRG